VRTTSDSDFWRDVKESLNLLLPNGDQRKVVINPAAGVILVRALPSELRQVEQYLKAVQVNVERQVMIEAKILEVELSADAQSGVNWSAFGRILGRSIGVAMTKPGTLLQNAANGSATLSSEGVTITPGSSVKTDTGSNGFYGLSFQSANFAAMLNFLDTQGKVQVLSSPRIATLNNQKAVLKVGSDELYVTNVSSSSTTTTTGTTSTPNLNLQPIFSGIALDVTPQIDGDGMVMLHVHPSITTVTEKSKSINLGSLGSYTLPLAASSVNETDSIVRVPDGQIVAIGGLMMQEQRRDNTGIQGLADLPFIGQAFRQKSTITRKRELVILMRPTIIRDDTGWPEAGGVAAAAAAEAAPAPEQSRIDPEAKPR
jgi:MSHA biogenesis protein MshL